MQCQRLDAPGRLSFRRIPVPEPGPGDALVRVEVALTCGTDLKTFRRGHPLFPTPTPLGHEYTGVVEAVGDGPARFPPGTRIVSAPSAPCGTCPSCRRGQENLCPEVPRHFVAGAYADYLLVPRRILAINAFTVPDDLPAIEAAFLEPLACVIHGIHGLNLHGCETAAVVGAGPIGLLFAQVLRASGVPRVLVLGHWPLRLEAARRLGADMAVDVAVTDGAEAVRRATGGLGADVVVECAGRTDAWDLAVQAVRPGGEVLLFGGCPAGTRAPMDTGKVHYGEVTVRGAFHFRPADAREAFAMIVERRLDLSHLISGEFALADLGLAFEGLLSGHGLKFAIRP